VGFDQIPGQRPGAALQRRAGPGEPGDGPHVRGDGAQPGPGRQPPAGPALGQRAQPGRLDPVEAQHGVPARVAEAAQQPHVARVLGVPAGAVDQVTQVADRVEQEPALDAAPLRGETQMSVPVIRAAVQQRSHAAGRQLAQQAAQRVRTGPGAPLADAALDRVGDLQAHRQRQRAQVEPVPAGQLAVRQPRGDGRAAVPRPAGAVDLAEPRAALGVPAAAGEAAGARARKRRAAAAFGDPSCPVRAPGMVPPRDMGMAQAELAMGSPA